MDEKMTFTLLKAFRVGTLQLVEKISADYADDIDTIPAGFNNNLRWNLGHVATILDQLAYGPAGEKGKLPKSYTKSFSNGTRPSDWNDETPSYDEIVEVLNNQVSQLQENFAGRLSDPLPKPFKLIGIEFDSVGSLLAFNYYHEGLHTTTLKDIMNAISAQK